MNYKRNKRFIIFRRRLPMLNVVCGIVIATIACVSERTLDASATNRTFSDSTSVTSEVIVGFIDLQLVTGWVAKKFDGLENEVIQSFDFVNDLNGFAITSTNLYRTADGGKSWQRNKVNIAKNGRIVSLRFTNELVGWCIVEGIPDRNEEVGDLSVFSTNDGGFSWNLSFSQKTSIYYHSAFRQEMGWITGERMPNAESQQREPFVAFFTDGTNKWNVIGTPSESVENENLVERLSFERISIGPSGCALFLNNAGGVYRHCGHASNWQFFASMGSFSPSYGPRQFDVLDGDSMWALMSTGGMNGSASIFTKVSGVPPNIISSVSLPNFYMIDGFVTPENNLIAAGWPGNPLGQTPKSGVILYSSDNGRTWHKIFEDSREIIQIQFASPTALTIWILTSDRQLTKLSADPK